MKKHYFIYTLLLALLVGMTTACEDRLNIEKHGNMGSVNDYYQTDEETETAVAAMYLKWRTSVYVNWWYIKNFMADDAWAAGGTRGDNTELEQLNEFRYDTSNSIVSGLYSGLYTLIYYANLIIEKVPGTTETMQRAIAEARVARAWAHGELASLWGTAPIVDHLLDTDEYRQGNGTAAATWAFVEEELQTAIGSGALKSKTGVNDTSTGIRLTQEAAKAFLGKAYLMQGKYAEAAAMLDEVIGSGLYDLYADYDGLFHTTGNNCCESIFELQMLDDVEQAWSNYLQFNCMLAWRTDKLSMTTEMQNTYAMGTYGFMNPRESLYEAFVAVEGEDGYRLNNTIRTYEQMEEMGISIAPGSNLVGSESYFAWKTRLLKEDLSIDNSGWQVCTTINLRIMRYAEVLLMAAEAHFQSGNTGKALEYINKIRERAQAPTLTSITMDDIKTEKRLELCYEGCRYEDLIRWGDAEEYLGEQGAEIPQFGYYAQTDEDGNTLTDDEGNAIYEFELRWPYTNSTYGFKSKHKLLPIPLTEIEVNPNMEQNEGW